MELLFLGFIVCLYIILINVASKLGNETERILTESVDSVKRFNKKWTQKTEKSRTVSFPLKRRTCSKKYVLPFEKRTFKRLKILRVKYIKQIHKGNICKYIVVINVHMLD